MYRVWGFVHHYSLLLISGAVIALIWVNLDPSSYHGFVDYVLIDDFIIGHLHSAESGHLIRTLTVHYLINDVLMAFFFAIAGKEVWEAICLKNGSLRGRKAATPLVATLGGMIGPVLVYLGLAAMFGSTTYDAVANGWAVPTATDIAFSYLVGRMIFGVGHPAVRFLLLLAIADDAAGLIILAIFYPSGELALHWLFLSFGSAIGAYLLFNVLPRHLDRGNQLRPNSTWMRNHMSFWPYLLAGVLSWYGFQEAGIHPALGLLPIVPTLPHADRAFGIFADAERFLHDLLNHSAHLLRFPVEVILFFFGLLNAGVAFAAISTPTWLVLSGLLLGKPIGILIFGWIGAVLLGFGLPKGMRVIDLFVLGCVAAIGFTVSLFIASVAFAPDEMLNGIPVQAAAKMGALFSFSAAILAWIAGILCKVEKQEL